MSQLSMEKLQERQERQKQQLEKTKKAIKAAQKAQAQKERAQRTHRLIEVGARVEQYCGEITDLEAFSEYLRQWSNAIKKTQVKPQYTTENLSNEVSEGYGDMF